MWTVKFFISYDRIHINCELKRKGQRTLFDSLPGFISHFSSIWIFDLTYINPGKNPWKRERIDTKIRIATPATKPPILHPLIVSGTEIPKKRLIAQNPESFGMERPIPPAQIAIAHRIGDTPDVAIVPAIIAAVVVRATVVEPCAQRIIWQITKHSTRIGILNPESVPAI